MRRLLVPVSESETLQRTVEYALESAINEADAVSVRVIYLPQLRADRSPEIEGEPVLERVEDWIESAVVGAGATVEVELATIEAESDLYTPLDVAEVLVAEVTEHDIDHVVLDPGYGPDDTDGFLAPIERIVTDETSASVEVAPFGHQGGIVLGALDLPRIVFVFTVSFLFYLLLAGGISTYGVVTGGITAGLVTATIGAISLWYPPALRFTPARFVRAAIYVPYLLGAIIKANIDVSRVILHPQLPIEPKLVRYHPTVHGPFPLATLANSITLTPGTLTMRVEEGDLVIHTLTPDARAGLADGSLERAVRFLFFGRLAMRIPTPTERADIQVEDASEGDGL